MPLGREIDVGPGGIVLELPAKAAQPRPQFSARVYCGQTVAHLSYCWALVIVLQLSTALCIVQVDSTTVESVNRYSVAELAQHQQRTEAARQ